jgi:hypothetical protein
MFILRYARVAFEADMREKVSLTYANMNLECLCIVRRLSFFFFSCVRVERRKKIDFVFESFKKLVRE